MQYSTNNHLKLMEGTDNVRRQDFVDNFNAIDNGLSKPYRAVLSTTDTFKVTTGNSKTSLGDLFKITVLFPSSSSSATKLIIDNCSAVNIVQANGNNKKVKANEICNLIYDGSKKVFQCASGGVDDVNFSTSDLLENKSANDSNGEKVNGTMKNVGQQTATINAGGKVVITKGYHDGTGYVQSNSMGTQLSNLGSTLTSANQLVNGVKAVDKKGNLITGTAPNVKFGSVYADTTKNFTVVKSSGTVTSYAALPIPLNVKPKFLYVCANTTSYNRELPYATFDINNFNGDRIYTHFTGGYSISYITFSDNSWILSDGKLYIPTFANATDTEHPYKYIAVL